MVHWKRRVCGLVGIARGSVRYERRQRDDRALRAGMKELAARPRFGYRRLHVLLRREKKEDGTMRWQVIFRSAYGVTEAFTGDWWKNRSTCRR